MPLRQEHPCRLAEHQHQPASTPQTKVLLSREPPGGVFSQHRLFQIGAIGGTPNQVVVRVGQLFQVKTGYDTNWYWDNTAQKELSCRKNFTSR